MRLSVYMSKIIFDPGTYILNQIYVSLVGKGLNQIYVSLVGKGLNQIGSYTYCD